MCILSMSSKPKEKTEDPNKIVEIDKSLFSEKKKKKQWLNSL